MKSVCIALMIAMVAPIQTPSYIDYFNDGSKYYQTDNYDLSVPFFTKSYQLKHSCKTAYLIADCYSHLSKADSCMKYAKLVLDDKSSAADAYRDECQKMYNSSELLAGSVYHHKAISGTEGTRPIKVGDGK